MRTGYLFVAWHFKESEMPYDFNLKLDTGNYTTEVDTTAHYGYFEHNKTGTGGGLWFEGKSAGEPEVLNLVDYDGVACLPRAIIEGLRSAGITVGEEFE